MGLEGERKDAQRHDVEGRRGLIGVALAEDAESGGGSREEHQVGDHPEPEREGEREPEIAATSPEASTDPIA